MIYLINSAGYDTYGNYIDLLKIGYTGDDKLKIRFNTYQYHNPTCKLLYTIPNCSEDDEAKLQYYFREYLLQKDLASSINSNEWFNYSEDIIKFFKTHITKSSLSDLEDVPGDKRKDFREFRLEVNKIVDYVLNIRLLDGSITPDDAAKQKDNLINNIIDKNRLRTISGVWRYVNKVFNIYSPEINDLEEDVRDFISKFNYYRQYTQKMKFLCESLESFTNNQISIILSQIPIEYSTYYNILGPERIKSLSYQKIRLSMECNNLVNNSSITKENIALEFKKMFLINNKYTLSEIKKIISNIYSNLGLNKSPKAVDILEYFDVLRTRAKDSTGTFVAAYKILKLKDNE